MARVRKNMFPELEENNPFEEVQTFADKQVDYPFLISRQIDRVAMLKSYGSGSFMEAIDALAALVEPLADEKYKENMKMAQEYVKKELNKIPDDKMKDMVAFAEKKKADYKWKQLMLAIYRQNLLGQKRI